MASDNCGSRREWNEGRGWTYRAVATQDQPASHRQSGV